LFEQCGRAIYHRSFTIRFTTQVGCLRLVISEVDGRRATLLLFNAALGLIARVAGPYGRLVLPDVLPQRLFLLATSVGIAPYLSMLEILAEPLLRGELYVHFMCGVRDFGEFLYASLLMGYAGKHPDFHLAICYSRQMPATPACHDRSGYVQQYLPKLDASTDLYLLCGNPAIVDECFAQRKAGGIGSRQVLREKYVFARHPTVASNRVLSSDSSGGLNDGPSDEQKRLIAEKMRKYQKV